MCGQDLGTTAVVVNYFSAAYTLQAVESILATQSLGPVHVVVVDNSCHGDEREILQAGLPDSVRLVINTVNVGFGQACNSVFENSCDPFFLLLNPDAYLLDGTLRQLQATLIQKKKAGAVSPQAFWDGDLRFIIPPAHAPLLFLVQAEYMQAGLESMRCRLVSRLWRGYSLKVWTARKPVQVRNLCGGHVLLRRRAVQEAGGLFDPGFFLYFEDSDLFVRMRGCGYQILVDPGARVVHHYDQCDPGNWEKKRELMQQSMKIFEAKHKRARHLLLQKVLQMGCGSNAGAEMSWPIAIDHPDQVNVPADLQNSWILEWSPNPDFIPAVGYFGHGPRFSFPRHCLDKLAPGRYYMRFSKPTFWGPLGNAYTWEQLMSCNQGPQGQES